MLRSSPCRDGPLPQLSHVTLTHRGIDASQGGGTGVTGSSKNGVGIHASSTSGTALQVEGKAVISGALTASTIAATTISAPAVAATTTGTATAVTGNSSAGIGVLAESSTGTALKVVGRLELTRSGIAVVPTRGRSVTVRLAGVTSASIVVATIQTNAGTLAVANAEPATGSFTINLTGAAPGDIKVAWIVVN